jgi:hypothetical protein
MRGFMVRVRAITILTGPAAEGRSVASSPIAACDHVIGALAWGLFERGRTVCLARQPKRGYSRMSACHRKAGATWCSVR